MLLWFVSVHTEMNDNLDFSKIKPGQTHTETKTLSFTQFTIFTMLIDKIPTG